jgi:transposase
MRPAWRLSAAIDRASRAPPTAASRAIGCTQLRCEPRAQALYAQARARGHTKKEARRILKRHLSDVIHRRMIRDLAPQPS